MEQDSEEPVQALDGVVEGTAGSDLIDTAFTGDPEGDRVDSADAVDPAAAPDDDLILAGEGADTVFAGAGSDTVEGGSGNDLIFGDAVSGALQPVTITIDGSSAEFRNQVFAYTIDPATGAISNVMVLTTDAMSSAGSSFTYYAPEGAVVGVGISGPGGTYYSSGYGSNSGLNSDGLNHTAGLVQNADGSVQLGFEDQSGLGDEDFNDVTLTVDLGESGIRFDNAHFDYAAAPPAAALPGDDSLLGGEGNDTIYGGGGDDTLEGGSGSDLLEGEDGADFLLGGAGNDTLRGGEGDDVIHSGSDTVRDPDAPVDGDNLLEGGAGNDTLRGGDGNDTLYGGDGDDELEGLYGSDLIFGGEGNDHVFARDQDDLVYGEGGRDTLIGGQGTDTLYGGDGNDLLAGSQGNDEIHGGAGNDLVFVGDYGDPEIADSDTIYLDDGNDFLDGGSAAQALYGDGGRGNDRMFTNGGDDTLLGGEGNDYIESKAGNDTVDGGDGRDTILAGAGDDTIAGGGGADSLSGGDGRDLFLGGTAGDSVDGGSGGDDHDTLDLTGSGRFRVVDRTLDADGNSYSGTINFLNDAGEVTGRMTFSEIETIVPCFTPGTLIATPLGERRVEDLRAGDRVITRDNGIQQIRWTGRRTLNADELKAAAHLQPVLIHRGALGNGLPERDMMVSPNHRVLVANDKTALYFEDQEVLVAAKHLTGLVGIDAVMTSKVTYFHFMLDQHEVVLSDGAWTESFQPGDQSLRGMDNAQRNELFELFPELKSEKGRKGYVSARRSLRKHEAHLLLH